MTTTSPTTAAPESLTPPPAPGPATFYRIDSARVSFREYTFGTKNPLLLLIALLLKLLRVRFPGTSDDPPVDSLAPFEVPADAIPADVAAEVTPDIKALEALGFVGPPLVRLIDDVLQSTHTYLFTLRHPDTSAVARVHVRSWAIRQPPRVTRFVEFLSRLDDARYVWSLSSKPDMIAPPQCTVVRKIGAPAAELWAMHRAALAGRRAVPIADDAEVRNLEEDHHRLVTQFHLARGVFAPHRDADRRQVETKLRIRQSAATAGGALPDADVLAEIERLQQKRSSWRNAILLFAVSLALFVTLGISPGNKDGGGRGGALADTWDMMAILVGVLFVHELGHYLAMRVFGYRNLRMFFIPFFGAAVSGRHYNVAGWKKVVVSLMGPVPGIVLGAIVGLTGVVLHNDTTVKVGLVALILNGFNLLPILPLDGGWVAHALLFSRNYILDAAFRVLAAGALVALGIFGGVKIFTYLGIFTLVALPLTFKLARVVASLRRDQLDTRSADDQTIPPDVAQAIITRLRQAFPKGITTKLLAQHTTHVFETLNARPPGWLATIGLGLVHLGSFVVALIFAVILTIQQRPDLTAQFRAAALNLPTAKHAVVAGEFRTWPAETPAPDASSDTAAAATKRRTIIATFAARPDAADAFDAVTPRLPESAKARLFGQTILVTIPADDDQARRDILDRLQARTKEVFVANDRLGAAMTLSCTAPDEAAAKDIEAEVSAYFGAAHGASLIPPWATNDPRTPDQRATHQLARKTYARLQMAGFEDDAETPADRELQRRIAKAFREGDEAESERLAAQKRQRFDQRRDDAIRAIRDEGAGKVDLAVVDRYAEITRAERQASTTAPTTADEEYDEERASGLDPQLAARMGQLPMTADGNAAPGADRESARFGAVTRDGNYLTFSYFRTIHPFDGAPAVVRWLDAAGCTDIKYAFHGPRVFDDGDDAEP